MSSSPVEVPPPDGVDAKPDGFVLDVLVASPSRVRARWALVALLLGLAAAGGGLWITGGLGPGRWVAALLLPLCFGVAIAVARAGAPSTVLRIGLVELQFRDIRIPGTAIRRVSIVSRGALSGPAVRLETRGATWDLALPDGAGPGLRWLHQQLDRMRNRARERAGVTPDGIERRVGAATEVPPPRQ